MKRSELRQIIKEELQVALRENNKVSGNDVMENIMISFQERKKVKDSFNKLMSDINNSQSVTLSQKSLDALEKVGNEIKKLKS